MKSVIIVTGASSGMGVSFARQLAAEPVKFKGKVPVSDEIWLLARRKDKLEETKRLIEEDSLSYPLEERKNYPKVKILEVDLCGKKGTVDIKDILEKESAACNGLKINVLVNNAGFGSYGEFANTDPIREMDMVETDCTSLTGLTGFSLPYMSLGSRIINTASLASFCPLGNFAVYGACKAYVLSFTVALAAELKDKGIRVTALCPGPVSTEFANVASKGARKEVRHGLSADKTVAHCIRASRKGKLYSLWAFKWKFKAFASKLLSRYAIARFTYKYCKRPSN